MNKSDIRVFIIDDDPTLGKAVHELVRKMGFQAVLSNSPSDALSQMGLQGAQLAIIDCMLPKMSGIQLAKKFKADGHALPVILMSGIFKDKSFVKDALKETGAIGFLQKPFNLADLQNLIQLGVADQIDSEMSPLESLLTTSPSPQEKVNSINAIGQVEAFDIPWLSSLVMTGGLSGALHFTNPAGNVIIYFSRGAISHVHMNNPESFFGTLLIEHGFLTDAQLQTALSVQSAKKLGDRLVDLSFLSPHAIDLINAEQTAIRLSRSINEQVYTVNFVNGEDLPPSTSHIDIESLAPFLVDWLNSKFSLPWLKKRYLKWMNSPLEKSANQVVWKRLWHLAPLKNSAGLVRELETGIPLSQILNSGQYPEENVYQVIHLLLLTGQLHFRREIKQMDEQAQIGRLSKLWNDMRNQDHFATLGVNRNTKTYEIKKTYYDLAKIFHPDKVPSQASPELKELAKVVFSGMTTAYETLSDDKLRESYLKELELGQAEKVLKAENYLEEGKAQLKVGQGKKALEKFEQAASLRPPNSEVLIYLAWSKLLIRSEGDTEGILLEVEGILNKIPPEDRHNSTYYFVKGFFQKSVGDEIPAKKNIQHALSLNPKFLEAERLLRTFEKKKENTNILHGDLKEVVGNLFRKK